MGMEISGIEKLKVNNAIIVFFTIVSSFCLPFTFLMVCNYKFVFDADLIKLSLSVFCAGSGQFALIYVAKAFSNMYSMDNITWDEEVVNKVIRWPFIEANIILIPMYAIMICVVQNFDYDLHKTLGLLKYLETGIILSIIIPRGFFSKLFRRRNKKVN